MTNLGTMCSIYKWWNRELILKCKLKCYVTPLKDPLGVSPSKGKQGTTRGKEKVLLTSVGIEPTTSGLDLTLITLIYTSELILCSTICVHSATRHNTHLFHLQTGTRSKKVPYHHFGNNVLHLQIGPRNKTVLNDQFGNNVFHAQIGTRNKTVLIYQFENNMFH